MAYEVEIRDVAAQAVLAVRGAQIPAIDIGTFMADGYGKIGARAAEIGVVPAGKPMVRYGNINGDHFDLEVMIAFSGAIQAGGDVYVSSVPAGRAATCEHVGPYPDLGRAYAAIGGYLSERGLESSGGSYEEYIPGHGRGHGRSVPNSGLPPASRGVVPFRHLARPAHG